MPKSIFRTALFTVLLTLFAFAAKTQEEIKYKEYSYTEFFQMIEDEEDSVFRLSNAIIKGDLSTDNYFFEGEFDNNSSLQVYDNQDSIFVDKALELTNVQFSYTVAGDESLSGALHHISFQKKVRLFNVTNFLISSCTFQDQLLIRLNENISDIVENAPKDLAQFTWLQSSTFKNGLRYDEANGPIALSLRKGIPVTFALRDSKIKSSDHFSTYFGSLNLDAFLIENNVFSAKGIQLNLSEAGVSSVINNTFDMENLTLSSPTKVSYEFSNNVVKGYVTLMAMPNEDVVLDWPALNGLSMAGNKYNELEKLYNADSLKNESARPQDKKYLDEYFNRIRFENENNYKNEQRVKGWFINLYRAQNDIDYANLVYVESKDLQTLRLGYLYQQDPHFNTFFKWRINQFLKIFSAYGTEPSRAIVFSVYVILAFALVYLFFPNHWDSHGKNRIKDRFLFFHKYLRLNKGIQDVYLEEQSAEIESSHAFRKVLDDHKDEVPTFFYKAAGPLLKWSTAGTTVYSKLLSRVDFLKGSWKDTDPKVRGLKTALTIIIFIIALAYDMLIKMLNALMLSINTFTTLGFGEIPIKGLPRYLAIIQGFIGWFMLTIFSVSLISQLLN